MSSHPSPRSTRSWAVATDEHATIRIESTDPMSPSSNTRLTLRDIERPGNANVFDASVRAAAEEIIARYPAGQARSALLPMLHLVQSEQGYVSAGGIPFCAQRLGRA